MNRIKTPLSSQVRTGIDQICAGVLVVLSLGTTASLSYFGFGILASLAPIAVGALLFWLLRLGERPSYLASLLILIPFVKGWADQERLLQSYRAIVEVFKSALRRCDLWPAHSDDEAYREKLAVSISFAEKKKPAECIAINLAADPAIPVKVSAYTLQLLYIEQAGQPTKMHWQTNRTKIVGELAGILLRNGAPLQRSPLSTVTPEVLVVLLNRMPDEFSILAARDWAENFDRAFRHAEEFLDCLIAQQVAPRSTTIEPAMVLAASMPFLLSEPDVREYIAQRLATKLHVPADVLLLLYEQHAGLPTGQHWHARKPGAVDALAGVLLKSGVISPGRLRCPLTVDVLAKLLDRLVDFDLRAARELADYFDRACRQADDFLDFLADHDLAPRAAPVDPTTVFAFAPLGIFGPVPTHHEAACLELLIAIGDQWLRRALVGSPALVESFTLVSLAIFFTGKPNPPWKTLVCARAATKPHVMEIALAWLQFGKDPQEHGGQQGFVTVTYLIANWSREITRLARVHPHGFPLEIATIRDKLTAGNWPTKLEEHLDETFERTGLTSANRAGFGAMLHEKLHTVEVLKRALALLTPATIQRYLETRRVTPYMITFDCEGGHIADLLECLANPPPLLLKKITQLGLVLKVGGQPKYNFKTYTRHARIGIVPKGWSLDEFHNAIEQDFNQVANHQAVLLPLLKVTYTAANIVPLKDVAIILHPFGLTAGSYQSILLTQKGVNKQTPVEHVQELFADILDPNEMFALFEYENRFPLADALMNAPCDALMAAASDLANANKKFLGEHDAVIRQAILAAAGLGWPTHQPADLGRLFISLDGPMQGELVAKAGLALVAVLQTPRGKFNQVMCDDLANAYFRTLGVIAKHLP